MALPEAFEITLKEVVIAKRLSASKITNLTEIAMKNMEHDTQLVSILYRHHKSLPTASAKVSSLYIFDALARAAKHHATKHSLSGDAFTQPGNSASFLFKMGGVVEGLFQDMLATQSPETKEKTKKILDIWIKGNTFPLTILSQLSAIFKEVEKVPDSKPNLITDPRTANLHFQTPSIPNTQTAPFPTTQTPPMPVVQSPSIAGLDPQAALLTLLAQAAASNTSATSSIVPQIATNLVGSPHLDATQLAVIQQLAHKAASVPPTSQSLTPAEFISVQNFPSSSGVNGSSLNLPSFRNEPRAIIRGYRSPESESRPDPHFDERDNVRGRYRGGFRNRGRGDKFHGRDWGSRDRDRYRDRDQSPAHGGRGGRSRSRSPPSRYGGRQDSRYFSPPRRPQQYSAKRDLSDSGDNESGKDEFGRDIRPRSSTPPPTVNIDKSPSIPSTLPTFDPSPPQSSSFTSIPEQKHHDQNSVSSLVTNTNHTTSSNKASAFEVSNSITNDLGMDSFDISTFDYTSPTAWEALGKMWKVAHGYLPSTEQLMQFVISSGTGHLDGALDVANQTHESNNDISSRGKGRGRGGFSSGRGAIAYSDTRNLQSGSVESNKSNEKANPVSEPPGAGHHVGSRPDAKHELPGTSNSSSSGRMQRIGDKWVFVRGVAMDVS